MTKRFWLLIAGCILWANTAIADAISNDSDALQCPNPNILVETSQLRITDDLLVGYDVSFEFSGLDIKGKAAKVERSNGLWVLHEVELQLCPNRVDSIQVEVAKMTITQDTTISLEGLKFKFFGVRLPGPGQLLYRSDGTGSTGLLYPSIDEHRSNTRVQWPYYWRLSSAADLKLSPWIAVNAPDEDHGAELRFRGFTRTGSYELHAIDSLGSDEKVSYQKAHALQFIPQANLWLKAEWTDIVNGFELRTFSTQEPIDHATYTHLPRQVSISQQLGIWHWQLESTEHLDHDLMFASDVQNYRINNHINPWWNIGNNHRVSIGFTSSHGRFSRNRILPYALDIDFDRTRTSLHSQWNWSAAGIDVQLQVGTEDLEYTISSLTTTNQAVNSGYDTPTSLRSEWQWLSISTQLIHPIKQLLITPRLVSKRTQVADNDDFQWQVHVFPQMDIDHWHTRVLPGYDQAVIDYSIDNLWHVNDFSGGDVRHSFDRDIVGVDIQWLSGSTRAIWSIATGTIDDEDVVAMQLRASGNQWSTTFAAWRQESFNQWSIIAEFDRWKYADVKVSVVSLQSSRGWFDPARHISLQLESDFADQWEVQLTWTRDDISNTTYDETIEFVRSNGCHSISFGYKRQAFRNISAFAAQNLFTSSLQPVSLEHNSKPQIGLSFSIPTITCG